MEIEKGFIFYHNQGGTGYKSYVVDIIKDGEKSLVIWKWYGKHKQWWHYKIENLWGFEHAFELGSYKQENNF
jgi:hypothetical protein